MKKITIDDDCRHLSQSHITVGYIGENKTEQIEFKIPEKYKNYGKKICFEANGKTFQKLFDNVTDNTVTFTRDMTKYDELYATVVFFKTNDDDEIVAKTSLLHILIEGAVNCPDDVSPDDPKVIILDKLISDVTNLNNKITLSEKERTNNESQRIENENHRIANETQREEYMKNLKSSVENGDFNGKDATINGFNTLNIVAGTNIDLKQENETLEINNTYQYDDSNLVKEIDSINDNFKNYSLITETGNKLDLTIDSKTYIMTLKLKDKDDNVLSTGSVDLPIESMIINVTYDNDNEKLTFTLQNGSVIDVPLDSLISGLVNETDLKDTLKDYAKTTDVPTKVSELENDSNYVKNTDYATSSVGGVIKGTGAFSFTVDSEGRPKLNILDYDTYKQYSLNNFIGKGTLENVIAGKNLETANNKVNLVNENSTDTQYPSAKCTYEIKNNLDRLKDNVLEVGEASDTYIHVEDSSLNELKELEVEGVCEQETTTGQASPSPDYPQEIKTITDSLSMTSNNGKNETEENYLESVITANLPEGEFIGKLNDTYKDTLKVVYKEDGKHHLVLNKIISKTVLNGTQPISYSKVINDDKFVAQFNIGTAIKSSSTMISDKFIYMSNGWASNSENISTGGSNNNLLQMKILQSRLEEISSNGLTNWLSTHPVEVYYVLNTPYEVNLGIVDMPLSYSGVTNIFTDSDLLPKINAKYYKDFKLSIKNYINSYIDSKLNESQSTANDVATADNTQSDENQNSDLS